MCGILGGVNISIDRDLLNTIKHRGPDRQDIRSEEVGTHHINLAHTRLSIVDLSEAGNQPMVSECGNYVLIFNGEIYNHLELRRNLQHRIFKGHSDTETLLYLLIEQGEKAIHQLNGIFSFAFLDKKKKKLILARDPFGVKPLYYFSKDNKFCFSSEIRPLTKIRKAPIDTKSLSILLNLRYLPSPYTLHQDIYKLRPGHICTLDLSGNRIENEISPFIKNHRNPSILTFDDAVEEYGKKLTQAVDRQLMGDVDMGVLLSGGIDSALVSGLATQKSSRKLKAFTVGFDSQYKVNETELAAQTAKYFDMEHHVVKMDVKNFFETFAECARIVEEPLATTSFVPMYYLSKIASEQVKVVLTGQGADEPLGGYSRYQGELLREQYPHFLFNAARILVNLLPIKNEKIIRGSRALGIKNDIERFNNAYSLFTPEEIKKMIGFNNIQDESSKLIEYYYNLMTDSRQESVEKMMSIDLRMDLADDLLLYTDKITMNFSLECRVPLLDLELVDFLESLPSSYKLQRGKTKIIHKAFAEKILPQEIINRPKFGFQSPTDIWFREKSSFVEDILLNGPIDDYISKIEIERIINQHKAGYNREKQIFMLLSINEWLKNNN